MCLSRIVETLICYHHCVQHRSALLPMIHDGQRKGSQVDSLCESMSTSIVSLARQGKKRLNVKLVEHLLAKAGNWHKSFEIPDVSAGDKL